MVELGLAIAWGKPTFLFRDDFRRCTDSEVYPLNLMLFTGLPGGWLGGVLVRLDRGDRRSRQGAGAVAAAGDGTIGHGAHPGPEWTAVARR